MKWLALVVVLAACADEVGFEFPIEPSTSPGTAGTTPGSATILLRGRVCVIDSIVAVTCASTGVANLMVNLGDQTTITTNDGTFAITPPLGTGLSFTISGPNVVTTSQALTARAQINVLRQAAFDQMLTINDITTTVNTGSIIAAVTRAGVPVSGVTATSIPLSAFGPFFDGVEPDPWTTNATGASGIVWFPGINAGPADVTFVNGTGGEAIVGGVQVINGGVTMVETILP